MTYAQGRVLYDADSHVMELPDFLTAFADPAIRDALPPLPLWAGGRMADGIGDLARDKAHTPNRVAELVASGDGLLAGPKGYWALGAFNGAERSRALDLLGFRRQLVFASFSMIVAFDEGQPLAVRYGAARAHNRAMAAFCAGDPRLMGVGVLPLDDPAGAAAEVEHILSLGLAAAWLPHRPCGGRSPGHDDLDPVWARLAEAGLPFVLHVGGDRIQVDQAWMNTGRPPPGDWLGGGENVRAKDMTALHHNAEIFLGAMAFDGVFERHPKLKGAVVELGAGWVPAMLKRMDWTVDLWRKSEPELAALTRRPSEQITAHVAFTPYPYENVGALIRDSDPRLYMFSSDYPHIEGGRNPLGRFDASLAETDAAARERFFAGNFVTLFPAAVA